MSVHGTHDYLRCARQLSGRKLRDLANHEKYIITIWAHSRWLKWNGTLLQHKIEIQYVAFWLPRDRRVSKRNTIYGKGWTSHGENRQIRITINTKFKIDHGKKETLARRTLKITKDMQSRILMILSRLMHKLRQNMNKISRVRLRNGEIN